LAQVIASEKRLSQPLDPAPCYSLMARVQCAIILCGLAVALAQPACMQSCTQDNECTPGELGACQAPLPSPACMALIPTTATSFETGARCVQRLAPKVKSFVESTCSWRGYSNRMVQLCGIEYDATCTSAYPDDCAYAPKPNTCKTVVDEAMKYVGIQDECFQGGAHDFMACVNDHACGPDKNMSLMGTDMFEVFAATIPKMGSDKNAAASPVIATVLAGLMGGVIGASLVALYLGRRSVGQPPLLG